MDAVILKPYTKYDENEIHSLYESVGWTNYTDHPEMLKNAFTHSLFALGAYMEDRLVGIIRVVGDGCSILYIQDLLVHPEFQRKGIGSNLLKEMLQKYQYVYQKVLLTDNQPETVAFYKSLGLQPADTFGCLAFVNFKA